MGEDDPDVVNGVGMEIPPSLRPISMFLGEAQKALRGYLKSTDSSEVSNRYKRVVICAINHALKLHRVVETHIDEGAQSCLVLFETIRDKFSSQLAIESALTPAIENSAKLKIVVTHAEDVLISEANEIMEFADEQLREGMREDASRNYHAASVYFRVLESILPHRNAEIHDKLRVSAAKVRETSTLAQNFVREHFSGSSCAEYYNVHGRNKLGKGSYGSVYLATHRVTGDERAVKVMNVDRVTSYYLKKLHTEIAILREVDHPNIIKLQDVFFGRRSVYLVTNLCRGGELYEMLTSGKSQGFVFREDRASRLMKDMLSSIKYLHSMGIVHRDLKLENFLFEGESSSSPLILIDFGLSKHFDRTERMRQRVGSCYYTAPEVLKGDYDHRCDLWSLGVICYMLLSGSPPFFGKTPDDIHNSTLTKEAEYPERRFKHVSHIGLDFMRRLLVKNPEFRMTADEALQHPFILGQLSNGPGPLMPFSPTSRQSMPPFPSPQNKRIQLSENLRTSAGDIVKSLRVFSSLPTLTKLVLELIAYTLTTDQISSYRTEFLEIDHDHSGTISLNEMLALGTSFELAELEEIFYAITSPRQLAGCCASDQPGSLIPPQPPSSKPQLREITYNEYIAAAVCQRMAIDDDRASQAFEYLDIDRTGVVTPDIVIKALGMDIDRSALLADIVSINELFRVVELQNPVFPVEGVNKKTFMRAWNDAALSKCLCSESGTKSSFNVLK
mmetsp:Transcript_10159/g.15406  ORF Transcript_10159/g.15406 Transcript_10159/m.15406 type:complete len:730 (-) Transcript_10159:246-2435(-)|eukprot:CAMPEP_0185025586 /NCGR_PEP_ID=MMETSP1103-20130426/8485_1 /TAXON_ID=36769 /ORGANISM="Paraphysomonas bandaiensis, Strain Caron Lab Isolate" /LENGTH=729 /DNA_ID=CAMNT_0027558819 /DNA_START=135 /DNA_END=2324 /DNA_ORIENTATION=+